jgi:PAS domain-containing protein
VSGETIGPVTSGSSAPAGDDALRGDFARATAFAPGRSAGFDGSALAGLLLALVTAVVLGLAQRDASRQRRSQPSLVGAGALRLGRDEDEAGVREQLRAMLAHGPFTATGTDCRSLQLLVQAAAHEGLEVRDPRGFIVVASDRLVRAYGSEPDHKRLPLRWAVEVADASVAVPDGFNYVLERTGPDRRGRRLAFVPGTEMRLWTGDLI